MTFGPWSPRAAGGPRAFTEAEIQNRPGWILRVYEAKESQRAVFTNVARFRDLGIPVFRRKIILIPDGQPVDGVAEVKTDIADFDAQEIDF